MLTRIKKGEERVGLVSFVYGSPAHQLRNKLWENLSKDRFNLDEEWITIGDYNAVTCLEDVSNKDNFHNHRCASMRQWIFKEGLIDLVFLVLGTLGREEKTKLLSPGPDLIEHYAIQTGS